mmetsp:Transcript_33653/g.54016  ORF Transcript_33653/g.54016 Transcript_33653/m.54016 type:complete len:193 (-) Transcript_33653:694-1272(-)
MRMLRPCRQCIWWIWPPGVCTPQPNLLRERYQCAAVRLPDGRFVCTGGVDSDMTSLASAEILEPRARGVIDATWRELPEMSVARGGCRGCVLSDGRFAALGGRNVEDEDLSSCEALTVGNKEEWESLPSMNEVRSSFACVAVAGCIVVAGGDLSGVEFASRSVEVFDEVLSRWLRLPCDLPYRLSDMGSALL